ncbi:META domain-containing protein [Neptuniibacter halophilus]|uniref:META domain-containing protein n=1 Tax=Neptuniibacter halophilus TaxID=651666 RepID=UPI002574411C|nr:META domain-containing protein [Neptuniibacter halophilus]
MLKRALMLGLLGLIALSSGCGNLKEAAEQAHSQIEGQFGYRERIALPPGATARVTLSDVSRVDVAAPVLAEQKFSLDGRSVPVSYQLAVPAEKLREQGRYAVRATIYDAAGQMLWTTDRSHLIDPLLARQQMEMIRLVRVQSTKPAAELLGQWRVEVIAGQPVIDRSRAALQFHADGRVTGSTGCNLLNAAYTQRGERLRIKPAAVTMRACIPALGDQEYRFLKFFEQIQRYRIDQQGRLILLTAEGDRLIATRP